MPFILKGLLIASAATGIKKAVDAAKDSYEAVKLNRRAQEIFDEAKRELLQARDEAATSLESLGELKLVVWDRSISAFLKVMENVGDRRVRRLTKRKAGGLVKGEPEGHGQVNNVYDIDRRELAQMKLAVLTAGDLVKGGVATLTGGSLLSLATVKGVQALAAASTGTAIRTLSGIAAKNATLAWLGGGALAAGGKGIAGGLAVLWGEFNLRLCLP